jgi:hypothetical protein
MSVEIKSFLHELLAKLNNEKDFTTAQSITLEYLKESKIKDMDKRKMIMTVQYQIRDTAKLYSYLYNALLKFEGLGTIGKKSDY